MAKARVFCCPYRHMPHCGAEIYLHARDYPPFRIRKHVYSKRTGITSGNFL